MDKQEIAKIIKKKSGRPKGTTTGNKTFEEKQYKRIERITAKLLKQVESFLNQENEKGLSLDEKREFTAKLDTLKTLLGKVMADTKSSHNKESEIQIVLDE